MVRHHLLLNTNTTHTAHSATEGGFVLSQASGAAGKELFLAKVDLIVQPSIYKYVNTSQRANTHTRKHTYKRAERKEVHQIIFLEGFNEYRMFMNTICSDSQRLEESLLTTPSSPLKA